MHTFTHDGLVFDVHDSGTGARGTVLALHGFPQTGRAWDAVRPALTGAGVRLVAPDQRGYSPGARPSGRRAYAPGRLLGDTVALLERLRDEAGGPVHLLGHDWGGGVAWAAAAARPDLLSGLTVVSTPHPRAMRDALPAGQALRSWYVLAFQVPWLPERVLAAGDGRLLARSLRRSGLDEAGVARARELITTPAAATAAVNWYRGLLVGTGVPGPVAVPTTYLWGARDPFLGGAAARATARYVTGPYLFEPVADGTHWLPETRPDLVAAAVLDRLTEG